MMVITNYINDDMEEFNLCLKDLLNHQLVQSMENYSHHAQVSCLEHSLTVAYYSFLWSKKFGLNYRQAARGALLHDFFLYDWHYTKLEQGLHGFEHPHIALKNAKKHFQLTQREQDMIVKHMWPLTLKLPKYRESWIVTIADKYCSLMETINPTHKPVKLNFNEE